MNMSETSTVQFQPSCSSNTSSTSHINDCFTENFTINSSTKTDPLSLEKDNFSSNSEDSPIVDSEIDPDNSDSVFWSSVPINSNSDSAFKSPKSKAINDLIESPIISKTLIQKDTEYHLLPRRLSFGSPEIARVEISTLPNMTSGSSLNVNFDDSPEAPKVLPRATRAAKMLERAAAANLMIRSSPQTITANKSRPSLPNNYRFGTKSQASLSTPTFQTSSPLTTNKSTTDSSPKRCLTMFSMRGKAFLKALQTNSNNEETLKKPENESDVPGAGIEPIADNVEENNSEGVSNIENGTKRKSILKQLNSSSDSLSSPRTASNRRIVNFRNPIVTQRLYDRFAAAKTVSECDQKEEETKNAENDNEENVSINVKTKISSALKRKRVNEFTVLSNETSFSDIQSVSGDNSAVQSEEDEPKKKSSKMLNQLFEETEDWEEISLTNTNKNTATEIPKEIENNSEKESEDNFEKEIEINSEKESEKEILKEEETTKVENYEILENQNIETEPETVKKPSKNILIGTRAIAMVNSVIGNNPSIILPTVTSPSTSIKKQTNSTVTTSPAFRRSYAFVQASKKKQEDLIKSITDAASCPNLFHTPDNVRLEKRSCLKSSDSEKKQSRRLSFAENVVTDELYYCVSEPSSYVGRDLSLRKQATESNDSSSPDESSSNDSFTNTPPTDHTLSTTQLSPIKADNMVFSSQNEIVITSPRRRILCHQSSIIIGRSHDDDDGEDISFDQKNQLDENSEMDYEDEDVFEDDNDLFDSQTIQNEMRNLAQDLTGQDASNIGEYSSYGSNMNDDLFNVSEFDTTAKFSDDENDDGDDQNIVDNNIVNNAKTLPNNDDQNDQQTTNQHEVKDDNRVDNESINEQAYNEDTSIETTSDISDSNYKDASSIFDRDNSQISLDNVSNQAVSASIIKITPDDESKTTKQNNFDSEPRVKLELPLSVARYVFDILKMSLDQFKDS